MLVTALEANQQVPKIESVAECLLHKESKLNNRKHKEGDNNKALTLQSKPVHKKGSQHILTVIIVESQDILNVIVLSCLLKTRRKGERSDFKTKKGEKHKANKATMEQGSSDDDALVVTHTLSANSESSSNWIIDSGATSHMCNDQSSFEHTDLFKKPQEVTLGDGHTLNAIGQGIVNPANDIT